MTHGKIWTTKENLYLIEHLDTMSYKQIGEALNRSAQSVTIHVSDLKRKGVINDAPKKRILNLPHWKVRDGKAKRKTRQSVPQNDTKCWSCRWATNPPGNKCPWSARLIPRRDWTLKTVTVRSMTREGVRDIDRKFITECPGWEEARTWNVIKWVFRMSTMLTPYLLISLNQRKHQNLDLLCLVCVIM